MVGSDAAGRRQGVRDDPARPSDADRRRRRPTADGQADRDPDAHADRPVGEPDDDGQLGRERDARRRPPAPAPRARARARRPTATATADGHPDGRADRVGHAEPSLTPEPTVATALAIASGVKVVGQAAAFSPDGDWFAFSARPSDGSTGPDVYVWRVGDDAARPLTKDHRTVFSSWQGDRIIAQPPGRWRVRRPTTWRRGPSRSIPRAASRRPLTVPLWRPTLDPTGRFAVAWDGTVRTDAAGLETVPATGGLRLIRWPADDDPRRDRDARSPASGRRSATSTSGGTRAAPGSRCGRPTRRIRPSAG